MRRLAPTFVKTTALVSLAIATPAHASDKWAVQPIQVGQETVRYVKGVPTLELELKDGIVRVTPLPLDRGRLNFTVAVYNDGNVPANFGIENVATSLSQRPLRIFTKDELVKQAKNRAFWSQFGIALLGATASAAAASQRDYYSSQWITPRGTYTSLMSAPSAYGQVQSTLIAAGTVGAIALVDMQLDRTILALGDQTLQLTTVDPGESYAGRIVLGKGTAKSLPSPVTVVVNWNGESYPFTFQVAKPGTPAPAFTAITRRRDLTDYRSRFAVADSSGNPATSQQAAPAAQPANPQPPRRRIGTGTVRCITCRY